MARNELVLVGSVLGGFALAAALGIVLRARRGRNGRTLAQAAPDDASRRSFVNRSLLALGAVGAGGMASAIVAFLWPSPAGGFGGRIVAGPLTDVLERMRATRSPVFVPEARAYLTAYPPSALAEARSVYDDRLVPGMEAGLVALFQTCPHLGCRVPWCTSSQWFECPCHASKYNRVGEKRDGPAPRGMDRFPVSIDGGQVVVDTAQRVVGPPIGTDTTGQQAEGPFCVTL